jgi:hypothetical protein
MSARCLTARVVVDSHVMLKCMLRMALLAQIGLTLSFGMPYNRYELARIARQRSPPSKFGELKPFQKNIREILENAESTGDFCTGGKCRLPLPGLDIRGVGLVSLPVSSAQLGAMKAVATQAPFGKGNDTVVDIAVRDALQIDADRVKMTNPAWHAALQALVGQVSGRLGIGPDHARAELYKILLYEKGGHFKTHQDTEKASGMFGTLVVQFPSQYCGGAIAVRHAGVEREFDMGGDDSSSQHDLYHVAFYADCKHEIREVTDGSRLVAVYSLCWNTTEALPPPPSIETALLLKKPLKKVKQCIGWILEHQYTPVSLSRYGFLALKGADRVVAASLVTAGELIKQEDPSFVSTVHVVQAQRDDYDRADDDPTQGSPELVLDGGIFGADGSEPLHADTHAIRRLRFYDDIINRELHDLEEKEEMDDSREVDDGFWKDFKGDTPDYLGEDEYAGNEAATRDTRYQCYLLAFSCTKLETTEGPLIVDAASE